MTATRMGLQLRLATLAALAGAWAAAAYFLWTTTKVPDGVNVSGLSARQFFSADTLHSGRVFERFLWIAVLLSTLATIVVFLIYSRYGKRFIRDSAAGPIGTGMLLAMLGFALVWLVDLPFQVAVLWWARRHDETHVGYQDVIFGGWLELGANFVFLCIAVLIAMGFARLLGDRWWLPAATVFVALFALRIFISPYLVPSHKLHDPQLRDDFSRLAKKEHVGQLPVRVQDAGDTTAINAFTVGFGPSKKVFVWDTTLDGRLSRGEVDFIFGHEIGHQARYHLVKAIGWYALFNFPFAFVVARVTRRRGGLACPEAIPLALLLVVLLNTASTPFQAAITRHLEAEADWMALQATRDPASGQRLFQHFSKTNHDDPNPPTWAYLWFEDHPTDMQRIGMVKAWAVREAPPAGS